MVLRRLGREPNRTKSARGSSATSTGGDSRPRVAFQNDVAGDSRSDADVWFIHCHPDFADCGDRESWSQAVRLTEESFDYQGAPEGNRGLFLADYTGLTSVGSDFYALIPVSSDGDPSDVVFVPIIGR